MASAGTILADRFVIEAPIGAGGMGAVFRALDRRSGRLVAVKIMRSPDGAAGLDAARFASEIAVLAELSHPAIVGFVAHGTTDDGRPFLAMEHLVGEDLEARLARGPLLLEDALALMRRVASALAEPHRRGIVHRDLKPSNLFLRDGAPERVTVLDFGVARRSGAGALTAAGIAIGTPEYMAPEQAQGSRDVAPAADVFALGCVLYRCITGVSPFAADHVAATLAKILFEDPPSVERERPGVPAAVGTLLKRMLERRAGARIADAAALLDELARAAPPPSHPSSASSASSEKRAARAAGETLAGYEPPATPVAGLGGTELELVSVILAAPPRTPAQAASPALAESGGLVGERAGATLAAGTASFADRAIAVTRNAVALPGLAIERLADGSIVAALGQLGESAADQALAAARGASALRVAFPGARVAIATARRLAGARGAMGEALDRAGRLLPYEEASSRVLLDEVTAGLLDGRVRTVKLATGVASLHDEPTPVDETRLLLGMPTPCVGREHELGTLEATLRASFSDDVSRAVLVVAPPGVGKSRLRHELLRRVSAREAQEAREAGDASEAQGALSALRLEARGELLRAGSPYGLLAPALRRAFGITPAAAGEFGAAGESDEARATLVAGVRRWCDLDAAAADPIASLLGELCDVPFPDEGRPELGAVRQDPRLLHARLGDALVALLGGRGPRRPRLVVIEDLHWGDRPSIDLLGRALRELEDHPLFVVAFARPELAELAPELWQGRVMELPLRPLGRRACERLVERVAGAQLDAPTIARAVAQSAGNALFLEELLRSAIEDASRAPRVSRGTRGDAGESGESTERAEHAPPETVLAMLQTRIGRLDTRARRVLRAASVFGESFQLDGVRALLGAAPARDADSDATLAALAADLAELTQREVVEPLRREPVGAEVAYRFRHALMRDAAYGLLTDDDRRLGHRLAATWLADREPDPLPIAEHWLRAEADGEAAPWLLRAAERALDRDDFAAAERLAKRGRGLASGAGVAGEADLAGEFASIEAIAAVMRWGYSTVAEAARFALAHTAEGSRAWIRAMRAAATVAAYGDRAAVDPYVTRLLAVTPPPELQLVYGDALLHVASAAAQTGLTALSATMLARAEVELAGALGRFPALRAWLNVIRCTLHRHTDDDLATQRLLLLEALRLYELVSASKTMIMLARDVLAEVSSRAGQHDEAEAMVRAVLEGAARSGLTYITSHARLALANVLIAHPERSRHAEAELHARELLAVPGVSAGYRAMSLDVVAQASLGRDALDEAEAAAREAIELSPHTPVRRWLMVAHLAETLVRAGRAEEADAAASLALGEVEAAAGGGYAELALLLAAGEAALAAGARPRAEALARRARQRIVRQAGAFVDREAFARFLRFAPGVERLRALEASAGGFAGESE